MRFPAVCKKSVDDDNGYEELDLHPSGQQQAPVYMELRCNGDANYESIDQLAVNSQHQDTVYTTLNNICDDKTDYIV